MEKWHVGPSDALDRPYTAGEGGGTPLPFQCLRLTAKILLPSARHLEEGRGTTIFELLRQENCISRLCHSPLGRLPPKTPK